MWLSQHVKGCLPVTAIPAALQSSIICPGSNGCLEPQTVCGVVKGQACMMLVVVVVMAGATKNGIWQNWHPHGALCGD